MDVRSVARPLLLLLGAWLLGSLGSALRADEKPAALDAKARLARRAALRSAAGTWITHRMRFPSKCPVCQGSGGVQGRRGGRPVLLTCPQCKGKKAWISPADYRAVYYELRSAAFQGLAGIKATLEAQYKEASQGRPWPTRYQRYRVRDWELVDDTHGIVWFLFDGAKAPTATNWVWAPDEKGKPAWCYYDSRSDGPWPDGQDAATPSAGGASAAWESVASSDLPALRGAVAGTTSAFWAADFQVRGGTLRVGLEPRSSLQGGDPLGAIAADALSLLAPLLELAAPWQRVETEWRTWWRSAEGLTRIKPAWTAALDRATFQERGWRTLAPAEQVRLLTWTPWTHAGWTPTGPPGGAPSARAPAPEPETPATPEPTAPAAPAPAPQPEPEPAPEEPAAPAPVAPPPAAVPPAAPPLAPMAPSAPRGPPPTMTAKAKKDGEAGVTHMKELLAKAQAAHDEGVLARQGGAHDLWQEKLEEARALLGEARDVWNDEVVAAMPGRDDMDREELAEEHFGGVWGDFDALNSIVRKTSRMH